jgi:uncharacterized membrane protein YhaH (DUF805 family)
VSLRAVWFAILHTSPPFATLLWGRALQNKGKTGVTMTFIDAIKTCFTKYADFSGCASRPEFWWWVLFTFIAGLVLRQISYLVSFIFSLAILLPNLAVAARRLHDTDRSGWWQLLVLIPFIGWIILLIWYIEPGKPNRYGG